MPKQYHTKGKDVLLSYFMSHGDTRFCAKDVMGYLKESDINMNQVTVYRNLEKLTTEGALIKSKLANDENCFYQYVGKNTKCHNHLHMQCKICGKIVHLEDDFMGKFYEYIHDVLGFCLEPKESVLMGICMECQKGNNL